MASGDDAGLGQVLWSICLTDCLWMMQVWDKCYGQSVCLAITFVPNLHHPETIHNQGSQRKWECQFDFRKLAEQLIEPEGHVVAEVPKRAS